jgi:hypothetical protein
MVWAPPAETAFTPVITCRPGKQSGKQYSPNEGPLDFTDYECRRHSETGQKGDGPLPIHLLQINPGANPDGIRNLRGIALF